MKIDDTPQSGRLGPRVTWMGRNGLVSRSFVTPRDPRTERQLESRRVMTEQARRFAELTDAQIDAWNTAAAGYLSTPRQGQSGPLTGLQLFIQVNCKLCLLGLEPLDTPPPPPKFPELAPQSLVISNTGGSIALKLTCLGEPGEHTVLRASKPQSPGVGSCQGFRIVGLCPPPVAGWADITALYTAQFGPPPVGKRIFVRASAMVSGLEGPTREFRARVPAP